MVQNTSCSHYCKRLSNVNSFLPPCQPHRMTVTVQTYSMLFGLHINAHGSSFEQVCHIQLMRDMKLCGCKSMRLTIKILLIWRLTQYGSFLAALTNHKCWQAFSGSLKMGFHLFIKWPDSLCQSRRRFSKITEGIGQILLVHHYTSQMFLSLRRRALQIYMTSSDYDQINPIFM